jgi:hypothetical protein
MSDATRRGSSLTIEDFDFTSGPLGSEGARIAQLGADHFELTLSHAPGNPHWPNLASFAIHNARGRSLRLDVSFDGGPKMPFNAYFQSYGCDGDWRPVDWQQGYRQSPQRDTLLFPRFEHDTVLVGRQVPMTYERQMQLTEQWSASEFVQLHCLGRSLGGRDICRIQITNPRSAHSPERRWCHYVAAQHPGEHNAQWRMAGMIDWLLSPEAEARDCLDRTVCHFVLAMSPDGPSRGWYRTNAQGVDMNRSYLIGGADVAAQAHEAYLCQQDLQSLMASPTPVTTVWAMHTWQGAVEPLLRRGPEFGGALGDWEQWRQIMHDCDVQGLIKPLALSEGDSKPGTTTWTAGPHAQFGVTAILCEGGSHASLRENLDSGRSLMQSLARFYRGVKR